MTGNCVPIFTNQNLWLIFWWKIDFLEFGSTPFLFLLLPSCCFFVLFHIFANVVTLKEHKFYAASTHTTYDKHHMRMNIFVYWTIFMLCDYFTCRHLLNLCWMDVRCLFKTHFAIVRIKLKRRRKKNIQTKYHNNRQYGHIRLKNVSQFSYLSQIKIIVAFSVYHHSTH